MAGFVSAVHVQTPGFPWLSNSKQLGFQMLLFWAVYSGVCSYDTHMLELPGWSFEADAYHEESPLKLIKFSV